MKKVRCLKCGEENEGLETAPYPGLLGQMALEHTCQKCWEAWNKFSVRVINDYKLRPFLPKDRGVLEQNMRQFLNFEKT